jgi:hypothetical protein
MKLEAKHVAFLRHPESGTVIGKLYLWECGEAEPMWLGEEVSEFIVDPLPGECSDWANWTAERSSKPDT